MPVRSDADKAIGAATVALGRVEHDVCLSHGLFRIVAQGSAANADANLRLNASGEQEGPRDYLGQSPGEAADILGMEVAEDNDEFISPNTPHQVSRAHAFSKALRYSPEQEVAHAVPIGVVDLLEAIEVEIEHIGRGLRRSRSLAIWVRLDMTWARLASPVRVSL